MSAYDDADAPWLPELRALLADASTQGVPTLGICLGAQLLAVARGGRVQVAAPPGRESGIVDVRWRPEAAGDAVVGAVARARGRPPAAPRSRACTRTPSSTCRAARSGSRRRPCTRTRRSASGRRGACSSTPRPAPRRCAPGPTAHDDVDTDAVLAAYAARADEVDGRRSHARRVVRGARARVAPTSPRPSPSDARTRAPDPGRRRTGALVVRRSLVSRARRVQPQVLGVDDRVRVALLGQEPLAVRREVLVDGVARDDRVEVRGPAVAPWGA